MPTIEQELDWQIYFAKNNDCKDQPKAVPFSWTNTGEPLTFRTAYPQLKKIFTESSENVLKPSKSENNFIQGHRKKMFSTEQIKEIQEMKKQGLSNCQIAKNFQCSEKTIRNYLKD